MIQLRTRGRLYNGRYLVSKRYWRSGDVFVKTQYALGGTNGAQIGAFIPPCEIPVLAGEKQEIRIIPGISINGSYTQRNQYEMLKAKNFTWDLEPYSKRSLSNVQNIFLQRQLHYSHCRRL